MNFSEIIKKALITKNMKPIDLARAAEISPQYMYELLRGDKRWNEDNINKVCTALDINVNFNIAETVE